MSPLLVGVTVAARIHRLVRMKGVYRWRLLVLAVYALTGALAWLWLPEPLTCFVAQRLIDVPTADAPRVDKTTIIGACVGVTIVGGSPGVTRGSLGVRC